MFYVQLLKTEKPYFQEVVNGKKNFEIRKNDRDYIAGDYIQLLEVEPVDDHLHRYTGRFVCAKIGFVTNYQQQIGFVVFSLLEISEVKHFDNRQNNQPMH